MKVLKLTDKQYDMLQSLLCEGRSCRVSFWDECLQDSLNGSLVVMTKKELHSEMRIANNLFKKLRVR